MSQHANANSAPRQKIQYNRKSEKWDFDASQLAYDKKKVLDTALEEGGHCYHVTPQYYGQGFTTIVTPYCFCSGLYVNKNEKSGKSTIATAIWLYRDWEASWYDKRPEKNVTEVKHESFWKDLHKCSALLDSDEYKSVRAMIGVPRKDDEGKAVLMTKALKPFVTFPKYKEGHELYGEIDKTRSPRIKAQVWLAKPKVTAGAKAKAEAGTIVPNAPAPLRQVPGADRNADKSAERTWRGNRMLCTFEELTGAELPMEELIERPFVAKFHLIWSADFFGTQRVHQLKISRITVFEKLQKTGNQELTKAEREDAFNEADEYRQERESSAPPAEPAAPTLVTEDEDGGDAGTTEAPPAPAPADEEEEDTPPPPPVKKAPAPAPAKAPGKATKPKKVAVTELADNDG
jgi:hypothetical protein